MSSAPTGLDVREYAYSFFVYRTTDGNSHFITARNNWLITKVQLFAGPTEECSFVFGGASSSIDVAAGGCLTLEPNGGFRGGMSISGEGALLIVEYWYQARASGQRPTITVNPP